MSCDFLDEFYNGKAFTAYEYFGAHHTTMFGSQGVVFRVYAPKAAKVELIGEFNGWDGRNSVMSKIDCGGVYEFFSREAKEGMMYKYKIYHKDGSQCDKQDPYGFETELRPNSASIIRKIDDFIFNDSEWMDNRDKNYNRPMSIYEMHFGSWKRKNDEERSWFSYGELCDDLINYIKENNFTHIEFMPLCEHPLDGSWGYQTSGYFSITSRYGSAKELMHLINKCHQNNIGVIIDFVPVHFAVDDYALSRFDGESLYEYDPSDVTLSQWGSCNFNYYRREVCSFVQSAANFWFDLFHVDGIRMDAVNNAIYWLGDKKRGVNMGAVNFFKGLNAGLNERHKGIMIIAEDSSDYLKVTAPVEYDGLGFDYKWDLGWMNDTLNYFKTPPEERKYHHHKLTFSMSYFYSELFILSLSHDEVVHCKGTILDKMYGEYDDKFAQCKTLYMYMFTHPGKKLNFMGNELGQFREWDENRELDWNLLTYPMHDSFYHYIRRLNALYKESPCLYECEYDRNYFKWLDPDDIENGTYSYVRGEEDDNKYIIVLNTSPNTYENFKVGYPEEITVEEVLNTDSYIYGGQNVINEGRISTKNIGHKNHLFSFEIKLGAYAGIIFKIV